LKLSQCRRYRNWVHRMRSWMTSEVKCAVNRALALGSPSTVVIEALNFSSQPGLLSKRMNRLVRRMGTGLVHEALTQKAQIQGFKLVEVNPAYTSQECSSCGFISPLNRKGNQFKCVCCGKQAHADAQAARNLVERFRQGRVCEYVKHTTVGTQGLFQWAARMRARLDRQTPGTCGHQGVIGDVRMGLRAIKKRRGRSLVSVESLAGLFSEIPVEVASRNLNVLSTGYSE
jgi:IS605 OrfB family transposase